MTARPEQADPTGTVIAGRYELVRALGQGSFGHTFLAHDRTSDRSVAIKVLDPRGAADWKAHELFEREAAVLRSLRHAGIPEVYEVARDSWKGTPASFLVMEHIEGISLAQTIEERHPLEHTAIVELLLELLGILDHLHGRVPPILHRDIKPANIIVRPDGLPALVDFGSVRHVFMSADEGGSTVVGTYGYMPYEQYMGQASAASDLYALGATFLHLLTGRPPRDFMTGEGRIAVPDALPGDPRMRPILARLLRPSPAERFATAREVRHALLSPQPVAAHPVAAHPTRAAIVARFVDPDVLGPAPRAIRGPLSALLDRTAPTMVSLMDTSAKPNDKPGMVDWLSLAFFSALTFGVLPLVFATAARSRRRKLRRFLENGIPTAAEILAIGSESTGFGSKMAKVSYQFEADGRIRRDADQILPAIADRWQPGDRIQILYLPADDYESVIISTG